MKAKIFFRIARGIGRKGFRVDASPEVNNQPLSTNEGHRGVIFHPTVSFAVEFNIPDEVFEAAQRTIATVNLAAKETNIEGSILLPAIKKVVREMQKKKK